MTKIYLKKPKPGAIEARILASEDIRKERAKVLSEVLKPTPYEYKGFTITIKNHKALEDGRLKVIVEATKDGAAIPVDNPLFYTNPPFCVPSGTWRKEEDNGTEFDYENAKEDPGAALKEIVGQTISLLYK